MTFVICFPDFLGFCYGSDTSLKYSVALLAWYIHVAKMFFFAFDIDIDIAFKPFFRNISETLWVLNSRLIMTMPLSWVWIWCTFMFTGYLLITVTFPPPRTCRKNVTMHCQQQIFNLESTFATSTFLLPFWDSFAMAIYIIHWATTCRGQRRGWARWQLTSELNRTPVQPGHWSNWLRWMWRLERSNGTIKQNHQIQRVSSSHRWTIYCSKHGP